ncbi:MAG: hypothetical protein ACLTF1_10135 [Clostridium sp.]|mgnify:FL=1
MKSYLLESSLSRYKKARQKGGGKMLDVVFNIVQITLDLVIIACLLKMRKEDREE